MTEHDPATDAPFGDDELRACLRVLEAIRADRGQLTRLSQAQRRELLTLAGQVAKPDRHDLRRMAKAFRRAEREAEQAQDRQAIERAGLRIQRRADHYTPLWLPPPDADAAAAQQRPDLNAALACYVCKQPYTQVHRYYDSMCRDCGDFNYAKREQTAESNARIGARR